MTATLALAAVATATIALGAALHTAREVARRVSPYTAKRAFTLSVARLDVRDGDTFVFHASDSLTAQEADELQEQLDRVATRMFGDGAHLAAVLCEGAELAAVIGPPGRGAEAAGGPPENIRVIRPTDAAQRRYGGAG